MLTSSYFCILVLIKKYIMDTRKHVKLYTNSIIVLKSLADLLDSKNIPSLIKNVFESAILGGYPTNENSNEIWVYEEDYKTAKEILDDFIKQMDA